MFAVTDEAADELAAFFEGKEKATVRVYMAAGGCSGPRLALALDEAGAGDSKFSEQGFDFCMESDLYEKAGDVIVDASQAGFMVNSSNQLAPAGGGCSGCTGCGS